MFSTVSNNETFIHSDFSAADLQMWERVKGDLSYREEIESCLKGYDPIQDYHVYQVLLILSQIQ